MKIAYVTKGDCSNVHVWSGLNYYILKTLKAQNFEVYVIDNVGAHISIPFFAKIKGTIYSVLGKSYDFNRDVSYLKKMARYIDRKLLTGTDCIFSPGTLLISFLKSALPKICYTDATFAVMLDFYYPSKNLTSNIIRQGNYVEQKALESCRLAIFSSQWAADSAVKSYKVAPGKVKVVPFGANTEEQKTSAEINEIIGRRSGSILKLLFIGVEWERKGGAFAVRVAKTLADKGVKTELHIAGPSKNPSNHYPAFVIEHGFLSKKKSEDSLLLNKLFCESHFFILPTTADCTPIVFCEASSLGLPCLTNNVGGIATIISDNVNGKLFSVNNSEKEYADYIESIIQNQPAYVSLCKSSFMEFKKKLNWQTSGVLLKKFINEVV